MNFGVAVYEVRKDISKSSELRAFGLFLKTELGHFREICCLIREGASKTAECKAVGEAYYELLNKQEGNWSRTLNLHLWGIDGHALRRTQTTNSVTESVSS